MIVLRDVPAILANLAVMMSDYVIVNHHACIPTIHHPSSFQVYTYVPAIS